MSFPISPAVNFREIDLTAAAVEQISSNGSIAGEFSWGPAYQIVRVGSEEDLVKVFGQPKSTNYLDFFTASSFLSYTSALDVVRVVDVAEALNATDGATGVFIANDDDYEAGDADLSGYSFVAKYAGVYGNSIGVSYVTSAAQYAYSFGPEYTFVLSRSSSVSVVRDSAEPATSTKTRVGEVLVINGESYQIVAIQDNFVLGGVDEDSTDIITLSRIYSGPLTGATVSLRWQYASEFGVPPSADQVYVVVFDADGKITSQAGTIIETFVGSKTVGAKNEDGTSAFIDNVINTSQFVRAGELSLSTAANTASVKKVLGFGVDGVAETDERLAGYDLFKNKEEVTAPLIIAGAYGITGKGAAGNAVLANYLMQNIAEIRKDSVVFISPAFESVVNNKGNEVADIVENRKKLASCSYGAIDSGWKYMYDRYNDTFRWIPLCGDHAGIYARVDRERETWFAAAGRERGLVKNIVKLAFNPDQNARDVLYPQDVNPVYNVPGAGPAFFGQKTLLGRNSAFSRIATRRLFIVLENTIVEAAKNLLFEFNDEFTRNRFVSIVEPFLRDVKGRRGVEDFAIVADERVNTPQVVQNNRFVGQIYIKPLYAIEFIRLDFVAVGASVEFSTVIGQF